MSKTYIALPGHPYSDGVLISAPPAPFRSEIESDPWGTHQLLEHFMGAVEFGKYPGVCDNAEMSPEDFSAKLNFPHTRVLGCNSRHFSVDIPSFMLTHMPSHPFRNYPLNGYEEYFDRLEGKVHDYFDRFPLDTDRVIRTPQPDDAGAMIVYCEQPADPWRDFLRELLDYYEEEPTYDGPAVEGTFSEAYPLLPDNADVEWAHKCAPTMAEVMRRAVEDSWSLFQVHMRSDGP